MVKGFKKLFPSKSKGAGIELAPDRINLAQLHKQGHGLRLQEYLSVPIPEGIFQEGQIVDVAAMAELVRSTLAENNLKVQRVACAVPGGRDTITRIIPVPAELDDRELREMVLNQEAGLYLPYPREEADVDYQKLGLLIDEDGIEKVQVLLVATRKEITDAYLETFKQAGLQLDILEISSFSLLRTLREQLRQFSPQEAVALVDVEFESTEISITVDGVPQFSRTVPIGTYQIQNALARAMNLPPSRDTDLLQGMTVPTGAMESTLGSKTRMSTSGTAAHPGSAAMLRVLGELADELRRSIDFYLTQGETMEVAQLLLAGPGSTIGQIDHFFTQRLSLPCSPIDPITAMGIEVPQEIPDHLRSSLGVVLGLGLREV